MAIVKDKDRQGIEMKRDTQLSSLNGIVKGGLTGSTTPSVNETLLVGFKIAPPSNGIYDCSAFLVGFLTTPTFT